VGLSAERKKTRKEPSERLSRLAEGTQHDSMWNLRERRNHLGGPSLKRIETVRKGNSVESRHCESNGEEPDQILNDLKKRKKGPKGCGKPQNEREGNNDRKDCNTPFLTG